MILPGLLGVGKKGVVCGTENRIGIEYITLCHAIFIHMNYLG